MAEITGHHFDGDSKYSILFWMNFEKPIFSIYIAKRNSV
jgi:hypothetical protein